METEYQPHFSRHEYFWKIHSAFLAADFWLISKGSREQLGRPIQEYKKRELATWRFPSRAKFAREGCFGMLTPKCLDPKYSYYLCEFIWQSGLWQTYSCGAITWQHLRINDVRNVFKPGSYFLTTEGNAILIAPVKLQAATAFMD
ncbi:hypothetical protein M595_5763 [Lyngbya aestuarii BL J]|uniref:Uncharacterized protein n=1 Tax=Lyngbya aestuarii BL J TaxID=1348334 RepID=U7QB79_9CYAN|nr:hypothetical protein [Lyngbya aestuarii]ERT04300.1 hypothetical protein M595_5763 [Lyngbya aestuarii BL J]